MVTFIPYKPPNYNIRKLTSKFIAQQPGPRDENLRIDPSDVPITVPSALAGAADNNWCQTAGGDSEATAQGVQACEGDLVEARGMCSDLPRRCHLCLILYSRLDSGEGRF